MTTRGGDVVPALALVLALAAVFALALQPIWATDIGWQLRVGRDLLARGVPAGIPRVDDLSWSAAGRPWIELRWAWTLALAWLERAGGYAAISWAAAALVTSAFAIAAATSFRRGAAGAWAAPITLAAALASQQRFLARPETATFVLVAVFLFMLHRVAPRRPRVAWLLPALQVVWVNTHTLFALGPALVAAYALAGAIERRGTLRRDVALAGATVAACLVNPYGAGAFAFAWTVWSELHAPIVRAAISELAGPFAVNGDFTNLRWFTGLLVAVPLAAAFSIARGRRIDAFLALATVMGAALALTSVRNLPLLALPAVPFLVHHLGSGRGGAAGWPGRALPLAASVVSSVLALALIHDVRQGGFYARQGDPRSFGAGLAPSRYPTRAPGVLRAWGRTDRVFATFHESSWLLADGIASYCDPRIEVFGAEFLARYLRAQADPATWAILEREARPRAIVAGLEHGAFVRHLRDAGWGPTWVDETAIVLLPPDAGGVGRDRTNLRHALEDLPAAEALSRPARDRLGTFLLAQGEARRARAYLAGAIAPRMRLNLAQALESAGEADAARRERQAAWRDEPGDPAVATEWALELLGGGRADEASAVLEPIVSRPDAPALAWALRGEAYGAKGALADAESCLARAAALDPADARIRRRLESVRASRRRGPGTR